MRVRADAAVAAASRRHSTDVYNCIIDILDLHKLTPGMGELPVAFYERADKLFNAGLTANAQLLEAAAFADEQSDAVDANRLSEILGYLYSAALKRGGYVTGYRIRRVVLSRLTKRS